MTIAGQRFYGVMFETAAERDFCVQRAAGGAGVNPVNLDFAPGATLETPYVALHPATASEDPKGGPGRPSGAALVAAAAASLTIDDYRGCTSPSAIARRVAARIAAMTGETVSTRCVRDHLGAEADALLVRLADDGKNDGKKEGKNSAAAIKDARGER